LSSLPLATRAENFAPIEGLAAHLAEPVTTCPPFEEWYKKTVVPLREQDTVFWRELHEVWQLIALFLKGKQILVRGPRSGWIPVAMSQSTTAPMRQQNKLSFYSQSLLAKFVQSKTDLLTEAGDDMDQSVAAAKAAEIIINYYEREIYKARFRQHEGLCGQAFGTCARYFYYDKDAGGHSTKPTIAKELIQLSEDVAYCAEPECGYAGSPEEFGVDGDAQEVGGEMAGLGQGSGHEGTDGILPEPAMADIPSAGDDGSDAPNPFPACPQCGSSNVLQQPGESAEVERVVGQEEFKLGGILGLSVPYVELRHDVDRTLEESEYVVWTRRFRKETLQQKFQGLKFGSVEDEDEDTGTRAEENVRRAVGGSASYWNRGGYGSQTSRDKYADLIQWWLSPCLYSTYVFPVDTKTVTGQVIPAGTKAAEMFPDGMYICTVSGIGQPLEIVNEAAKDHWVTYPYHLQLFTGIGQGIDDAIEMQRQWNNILSLVYTQIRTAAIPGWLYDKSVLAPDDARNLGQPQNNVPADLRIHEGRSLRDLIHKLEPGQIPAHIPWYIGQLDSNMQTSMGALANQGLPGADSSTATGSRIFQAEQQGFQAPWTDLKAEADVRSGYIFIELFKKHCPDPRFFPFKGKRGAAGGVWLSAEKLANGKIVVTYRPGSYLPETKFDKQESLAKALQFFGGPQGLVMAQQMIPDFVAEAEIALNIPLTADQHDIHAIRCRERLQQLQELEPLGQQMLQMAQMMPPQVEVDPMTRMATPVDPNVVVAQMMIAQMQPPPCIEEPGHLINLRYYRNWFLDDEAKEASPLYRACVQQLVKMEAEFAAEEKMLTGAMEDPMGAMQAQQGAQQQQADGQRKDEQHGSKMKTDQQKRDDSAAANLKPGGQQKARPAMAGV
jgi:hypothetical protein